LRCFTGRVLNQRDHSTGHEPAAPDRRPRPGHFNDLDQPAPSRHLHPAARPRGCNLVGPGALPSVDNDFDAITFHTVNDPPSRAISPGRVRSPEADELLARAQTEGVELLGRDGLLSQVITSVLERALAGEMSDDLGCQTIPAG
jgi:hypothetical protein